MALLSILATATTPVPPDRVIIVSRHGVRRQFPSKVFNFSLYAPNRTFETSDAAWGVNQSLMGVLTQHGYRAVERMGAYQAQRYKSLLSACDAFVYCEANMPRDEKTAEAFFKGLGCELPPLHTEGAEYLIDQGKDPRGEHGECALGTQAQVEGRVGGGVDEYARLFRPLVRKMGTLLGCCDPSLCGKEAGSECLLEELPSAWDPDRWYTTFLGPLYAGKYFAEWIELTMLNGMEFAWGERTVEQVMELSAFVTLYRSFEFDLLAAQPFGSALLAHLAASLRQWADGAEPHGAVAHGAKARLVYYAAHDTNILYLAELLGLKWLAKGWQPNHTPPGGMLVLEAFAPSHPANPSAEWQLALFFDVQTPTQIREASPLSDADAASTPSRVPVTIPGCSTQLAEAGPLLCSLSTFLGIVARAVRPECITPRPLRAFVDNLSSGGGTAAKERAAAASATCALVAVAVAAAALGVGLFTGRAMQQRRHAPTETATRGKEMAGLPDPDAGSDSDIKPLV